MRVRRRSRWAAPESSSVTLAEDGKQRAGVASARIGNAGGLSMREPPWTDLLPDGADDSPPGTDDDNDGDDVPSIPIIPAHV